MANLQEQIQAAFPAAKFDSHASDLYVKDAPGVMRWLQENYRSFRNIRTFIGTTDGYVWLDIPFAHQAYWDAKL